MVLGGDSGWDGSGVHATTFSFPLYFYNIESGFTTLRMEGRGVTGHMSIVVGKT